MKVSPRLKPMLRPLSSTRPSLGEYDPLFKAIGDARVIMIGEASHGTHEFYHQRAEITKRLIQEKQINLIAVEADWPDAYRINRYVRGNGTAEEALSDFRRFPRWMWRNNVTFDFIQWLRKYNDQMPDYSRKIGFYGLDLYSLFESVYEVVQYLKGKDPELAQLAKQAYECFQRFHGDTNAYAYSATFGSRSCEKPVKNLLEGILAKSVEKMKNMAIDGEELFYAQINSKVVKNAEEYYRGMFTRNTWNLRDTHMVRTLEDLLSFYQTYYKIPSPKGVIWAHNSHLGDAGATEDKGKTNIGEIARERFGLEETFNIGFSTYTGTVTAADDWDSPALKKKVRVGLPNSYELLFHQSGVPNFCLIMRSSDPEIHAEIDTVAIKELAKERLQRAIGVVYRPETERQSHYFFTSLPYQFDAMIHFDETSALQPLDTESYLEAEEPETYPFGV